MGSRDYGLRKHRCHGNFNFAKVWPQALVSVHIASSFGALPLIFFLPTFLMEPEKWGSGRLGAKQVNCQSKFRFSFFSQRCLKTWRTLHVWTEIKCWFQELSFFCSCSPCTANQLLQKVSYLLVRSFAWKKNRFEVVKYCPAGKTSLVSKYVWILGQLFEERQPWFLRTKLL